MKVTFELRRTDKTYQYLGHHLAQQQQQQQQAGFQPLAQDKEKCRNYLQTVVANFGLEVSSGSDKEKCRSYLQTVVANF